MVVVDILFYYFPHIASMLVSFIFLYTFLGTYVVEEMKFFNKMFLVHRQLYVRHSLLQAIILELHSKVDLQALSVPSITLQYHGSHCFIN